MRFVNCSPLTVRDGAERADSLRQTFREEAMKSIAMWRRDTAWKGWPVAALLGVLMQAHTAVGGFDFIGAERVAVAPNPDYMLAGDLTDDGLTDLVVVSPASTEVDVFVASPDTPARFAPTLRLAFGSTLRGPALGDLNADGRLDLVVADASARAVWVLLGNGDGSFGEPYAITVSDALHPSSVAIGNFDDAGKPDLAVADERRGRVFLLRNDNGATPCFVPGGDLAVGAQPTQIGTADFNGDGKADLVTLNLGGSGARHVAFVLWKGVNQGSPEFESATAYTVGEGPSRLVIADFTGDGRPDVATVNSDAGGYGGEISVLVNQAAGGFSSRTVTPVACPFFTYGAPCRLLTLATGDLDGNGSVDLAVALSDPRPSGGSAIGPYDAMQLLSGRGDGRFVHGAVFAIQKAPLSMVTGMITGRGKVDIAVADERSSSLQAFVNRSGLGPAYQNGHACAGDDSCLSSHCTNGVCCATQCNPQMNEVCNIPGREGTCVPLIEPIGCRAKAECPDGYFCVDGLCCDQPCEEGRCNRDGAWGLCLPNIPDGQPCYGDDDACASEHCGPNLVCCREACDAGFCDSQGLCRGLVPIGNPCQEDAECQSDVCDVFDGICCDRRCDFDMESCLNGTCGRIPGLHQHRAAATDTPIARTIQPTSNPCGSCPSGTHRDNGVCVGDNSGSGCSTIGGDSMGSTLSMGTLLALLLWMRRRSQLSRRAYRSWNATIETCALRLGKAPAHYFRVWKRRLPRRARSPSPPSCGASSG
jgi:hypothetical protein